MKYLLLPLRGLYLLYALLVFLALMLLVIPFVVIASFFGKIRGGNFIQQCCVFWAGAWFFLIGIWHRDQFESPHDTGRQYIFVANHIAYIDIPIIFLSVKQPLRVLGKAEMGKLPLFGFIYRNAAVMVDRNSPENRAKSVRTLKAVIRKGISIFIFPEGTFNETPQPLTSFYDGAFRIAIETQTPIKPLLFLDTFARHHYRSIFTLNPGRSRTIFLDEVPVEGLTIKDVPLLKQRVYQLMEEKLRAYRADWIAAQPEPGAAIRP
ncbi:MAG: lysophospholipid acyltransferase family protein [Candidatus Pseudobacter hemicellulosilyticus]|uniref:Lysophospholipid acyltransferase family protein n=1 Tax=Candidatus Pseudobacter hemicellulosilyticus TaxID=3121375 RepID=A0AAJ5WR37_9BACT|nr:MAG: lysophospholipid acyltransferase family protein [Pseudobacter sp.]